MAAHVLLCAELAFAIAKYEYCGCECNLSMAVYILPCTEGDKSIVQVKDVSQCSDKPKQACFGSETHLANTSFDRDLIVRSMKQDRGSKNHIMLNKCLGQLMPFSCKPLFYLGFH